MPTDSELRTILASVRPARVAVFTDSSDPDWEYNVLRIIEFLTTAWGGQHSLIVPTDGKTIAPEFWTLLESFDPDYLHCYSKSLRDLKLSRPEAYETLLDREVLQHGAGASDSAVLRREIDERMQASSTSPPFAISLDLDRELLARLVPFYFQTGVTPGRVMAQSTVSWPLTPVAKILPNCEHSASFAVLRVDLPGMPAIWHAAMVGSVHTDHHAQLVEAGLTPIELPVTIGQASDLFDLVITGSLDAFRQEFSETLEPGSALYLAEGGRELPFSVSMAQLSLYRSVNPLHQHEPFAVVIGDTLEDFCLYYGLLRLRQRAAWLPTRWLEESANRLAGLCSAANDQLEANAQYTRLFASSLSRAADDRPVHFYSLSRDTVALEKLIVGLRNASGREGSIQSTSPLGLQVFSPVRAYNRGNAFRALGKQFEAGRSVGPIETPHPRYFSQINLRHHRWITELVIERQPLPQLLDIGPWMLHIPQYSSHDIRATKSGLAYFCPNTIIFGDDLDPLLVRPSVFLPDAFETVSFLLRQIGHTARISDKGFYAQDTLEKFGGLQAFAAALRDPITGGVLNKYLDNGKRVPGSTDDGVYLSSDRRVYLDLPAVAKIAGDESRAADLLDDLVQKKVLHRGFLFRCSYCRNSDWYALSEVTEAFRCRRCSREQVFTKKHWKMPNEPHLYYRLDEIVYQGMRHDMSVPILGLECLRVSSQQGFLFSHELEIWSDGSDKPLMEVDIACVWDRGIIIGEAKRADQLGSTPKDERAAVIAYRDLALKLGAAMVVFATAAADWREQTKVIVNEAFAGYRIQPMLITHEQLYPREGAS